MILKRAAAEKILGRKIKAPAWKKWYLLSADGTKNLGGYRTKKEVVARERAVQYFKYARNPITNSKRGGKLNPKIAPAFWDEHIRAPKDIDKLLALYSERVKSPYRSLALCESRKHLKTHIQYGVGTKEMSTTALNRAISKAITVNVDPRGRKQTAPHIVADIATSAFWESMPRGFFDQVFLMYCPYPVYFDDAPYASLWKTGRDGVMRLDEKVFDRLRRSHRKPWGTSKLFERAARALKPGGRLVLIGNDAQWWAEKHPFGEKDTLASGTSKGKLRAVREYIRMYMKSIGYSNVKFESNTIIARRDGKKRNPPGRPVPEAFQWHDVRLYIERMVNDESLPRRLERFSVEDLKPWRLPGVHRYREKDDPYQWDDPLVIVDDFGLVDGNHRLSKAIEDGAPKEFDVLVFDPKDLIFGRHGRTVDIDADIDESEWQRLLTHSNPGKQRANKRRRGGRRIKARSKRNPAEEYPECAWCGGEIRTEDGEKCFRNRRGEVFCSASHRSSSNRSLKQLQGRFEVGKKNPGEQIHRTLVKNPRTKNARARYAYRIDFFEVDLGTGDVVTPGVPAHRLEFTVPASWQAKTGWAKVKAKAKEEGYEVAGARTKGSYGDPWNMLAVGSLRIYTDKLDGARMRPLHKMGASLLHPVKNPGGSVFKINLYNYDVEAGESDRKPFRRISFPVPKSWATKPDWEKIKANLAKIGYTLSGQLAHGRLGREWDYRADMSYSPNSTGRGRHGTRYERLAAGPGPDISIDHPYVTDWPTGNPKDRIKGGLADKYKASDFDPKELRMGMKVEMEHTTSRKVAEEIAMDHLVEFPNYYSELAKMEAGLEAKKKGFWQTQHDWDQVLIDKGGKKLTRGEILEHYKEVEKKIWPFLKGGTVMVYIGTGRNKAILRRKGPDGKHIKLTKLKGIDDPHSLEYWTHRRVIEFHPVITGKTTRLVWVDLDPKFTKANEAGLRRKMKAAVPRVKAVLRKEFGATMLHVYTSGKRGIHVEGNLPRATDADKLRRSLRAALVDEFSDDKTFTAGVPKSGQIRLDTNLIKHLGSIRAPYSMSVMGRAKLPVKTTAAAKKKNPAKPFDDVGLIIIPRGSPRVLIFLINPNILDIDDAVIGFIWLDDMNEEWDPRAEAYSAVLRVAQSVAKKGYGPILYEAALMFASEQGDWLMPGSKTSDRARPIWEKMLVRKDVNSTEVDLAEPQDDDVLDRMYEIDASARLIKTRDGAVERGKKWMEAVAEDQAYSRQEIDILLWEAGSSFFSQETDRNPSPARNSRVRKVLKKKPRRRRKTSTRRRRKNPDQEEILELTDEQYERLKGLAGENKSHLWNEEPSLEHIGLGGERKVYGIKLEDRWLPFALKIDTGKRGHRQTEVEIKCLLKAKSPLAPSIFDWDKEIYRWVEMELLNPIQVDIHGEIDEETFERISGIEWEDFSFFFENYGGFITDWTGMDEVKNDEGEPNIPKTAKARQFMKKVREFAEECELATGEFGLAHNWGVTLDGKRLKPLDMGY